jgi:hypothetical protein
MFVSTLELVSLMGVSVIVGFVTLDIIRTVRTTNGGK